MQRCWSLLLFILNKRGFIREPKAGALFLSQIVRTPQRILWSAVQIHACSLLCRYFMASSGTAKCHWCQNLNLWELVWVTSNFRLSCWRLHLLEIMCIRTQKVISAFSQIFCWTTVKHKCIQQNQHHLCSLWALFTGGNWNLARDLHEIYVPFGILSVNNNS